MVIWVRHRRLFLLIVIISVLIVTLWNYAAYFHTCVPRDVSVSAVPMVLCAEDYSWCESGDNVTGYSRYVVPNIVHFVRLDQRKLDFVSFVTIRAAIKNQKPD